MLSCAFTFKTMFLIEDRDRISHPLLSWQPSGGLEVAFLTLQITSGLTASRASNIFQLNGFLQNNPSCLCVNGHKC